MSLRDKILTTDDIQTEMVEVPEWGVTVEVRGMNGVDRGTVLESAVESGGVTVSAMYADTIIATAYDPETGERLFTPEDRPALMAKSAAALDRLSSVGMRLSGMDDKAVDDAKRRFPEESDETPDV